MQHPKSEPATWRSCRFTFYGMALIPKPRYLVDVKKHHFKFLAAREVFLYSLLHIYIVLLLTLLFMQIEAKPLTTLSNSSLYNKSPTYSTGILLYPYFAPRMAHATAAFVSASPPTFTTESNPSSNDDACQ